jgi:uncharacterized protein YndB with AHSA1/START domain
MQMAKLSSMKTCLFLVCLILAALTASADVIETGPSGFTVKTAVDVAAPATRVYQVLTERVGSWWDKDHTYSGNAANLSIDAKPGGCFCERFPGGGGVSHMTVVYAEPGKLLKMSGGLGPLGNLAVTGVLSWKLTETNGRTSIETTYTVGGYAPGGVGVLAAPVDAVLSAQVKRLAQFVSTH